MDPKVSIQNPFKHLFWIWMNDSKAKQNHQKEKLYQWIMKPTEIKNKQTKPK